MVSLILEFCCSSFIIFYYRLSWMVFEEDFLRKCCKKYIWRIRDGNCGGDLV